MIDDKLKTILHEKYGKQIHKYVIAIYGVLHNTYVEQFNKELEQLLKDRILIRETGSSTLKINTRIVECEVLDRIQEYRQLWNYRITGIKGKMGNKDNCVKHIKKFTQEHKLTFDEVLQLANYYVNNFKDISGYIQQADYFLYKEHLIEGKKITRSRAASLLGEYKDFILEHSDMI